MSTDRELDDRLAAAAGVHDTDLPVLPEEFLPVLRSTVDEPASVVAARQLVADARDRRHHAARRGRRVLVRISAGVLALAAAWTTAVLVVDDPGRDRSPDAAPSTVPTTAPAGEVPLDPSGGLTLVAAEAVPFPYSLDPPPAGLSSTLVRSGGLESFSHVDPIVYRADYRSADDPGFSFTVSARDPRVPPPGSFEAPPYTPEEILESGTVPVEGVPADFVEARFAAPHCRYAPSTQTQEEEPGELCADTYAELYWQRADGLWVGLAGEGERYGQVSALVAVAESIVDRPQPVHLQFRLAPQGWLVSSYESPAHLTLVSEVAPTSLTDRISVSLLERWRGYTEPDVVLQGMTDGNPVEAVTVNGAPARLVSVPDQFADPALGRRMWNLAAQFTDGPLFLFQAPDTLTREDVLAMAEGLSYTP